MDEDRVQTREGKPKRWFADSKKVNDDFVVYLFVDLIIFCCIDEHQARLFSVHTDSSHKKERKK